MESKSKTNDQTKQNRNKLIDTEKQVMVGQGESVGEWVEKKKEFLKSKKFQL